MLPWRQGLIRLLIAGLSFLVADLTARTVLAMLDRTRGIRYHPVRTTLSIEAAGQIRRFAAGQGMIVPDSALGWVPHPGGATAGYHVSPQGLRSRRTYAASPPPNTLRIATFGDSFVYGDELEDTAVWAAQLEGPGLEVLNFGVPGYGFDQAYLRYMRDGRAFHPSLVVIGIYADDVNRGLNVWHPFMTGEYWMPSAKPRYRLADSLELLANPLPSHQAYDRLLASPESTLVALGSNDYFFQTRERASEWDFLAIVRLMRLTWQVRREREDGTLRGAVLHREDQGTRLAIALLGRFVAQVRADGAIPLAILFPDRLLYERFRRTGVRPEGALVAGLANVPVIDLYRLLGPTDFATFGHLSPSGSRKVARAILTYLSSTGKLAPGGLQPNSVPEI